MKIPRHYDLKRFVHPNKVLVIFGPRRVGKTTLLKDYLRDCGLKYRLDSGDLASVREVFNSDNLEKITEYAAGYELIVIDEAQRIEKIGWGLKILVDHVPGIRVIVTGSSAFELAGQVGEPLTGRKTTISLFPIAQSELSLILNRHELRDRLSSLLVYGSYPEAITATSQHAKIALLEEITGSYLFKDILELDRVRNAKALNDLLRLIAHQVGSEVSLNELAAQLGMDKNTVARYLDLLEKSFVLFNLRGFSRNLRKEVTKKSKYYFYDNGVRNAVISNFNELEKRNDVGALWENFLIMERLKSRTYHDVHAQPYFWRTWDQKEIDLIEEREGKLFGYEFKWGNNNIKEPKEWLQTYSEASYQVVNKENYLDFLLPPIK